MLFVPRVLPEVPYQNLAAYEAAGGGDGLKGARKVEPDTVISEIEASGLRGRGGAGFPTGTKWRTVATARPPQINSKVIVNGAEGEPGTFKDRAILRANPYAVIEGALIAAWAVSATEVVIALKARFAAERDRVREAIAEMDAAGWLDWVSMSVFDGPDAYLFGEETALLEALDGRAPFPRVAPPYREGVDEPKFAAEAEMAPLDEAPVLVNNVETLANVAGIIANGAEWFRQVGTHDTPGTVVCTVTGATETHGVGEVATGTPLRQVIDQVGGGMRAGHALVAVMNGVSAAPLLGDELDIPLSHEVMTAAGTGLGSASFLVLGDQDDVVAAMAGASRFLAVESCGQCEPCKRDGLDLADRLARLARNEATQFDLDEVVALADTVSNEARCALARQHEAVVKGFLERFPEAVDAHVEGRATPVEPMLVAELVDIEGDVAVVDENHARKQPDWTFNDEDSGKWPASLY